MAEYFGPPGSENDPSDSFDEDPISQEDVLSLIEANLGSEEQIEEESSPEALLEVWDFLKEFKIVGAEEMTTAEVELLWHQLGKDPSLVRDFVYIVMDVKTELNYSNYPLALSVNDLLAYAAPLDNPQTIRPHFIEKTGERMVQLGINRRGYVERALGGPHISPKNSEAIRFTGWLVGQPFLKNLNSKINEFQSKYEVETLKLTDLMAICTIEVYNQLNALKKLSDKYRNQYDLETEAKRRHEEVVTAMEGIYKMCGISFMDRNI